VWEIYTSICNVAAACPAPIPGWSFALATHLTPEKRGGAATPLITGKEKGVAAPVNIKRGCCYAPPPFFQGTRKELCSTSTLPNKKGGPAKQERKQPLPLKRKR